MNLTKFLIIDTSFILLGLSALLTFQLIKAKGSLLGNINNFESSDDISMNLPTKTKLVELEKIARNEGSGIESKYLIGLWSFVSVWKKETDQEDIISSSLLKLFSASLEIKGDEINKFAIINSIRFGILLIRFTGQGNLKGKQPLLPFFFDCIELMAGSKVLLSKALSIPEEKNRPFFALISMEENGKWLAARGRGGGLALWVKG